MENETALIVAYIRDRAAQNASRGGNGSVGAEHSAAAAEFSALASDIEAGLHRGE